MAIDPTPGGPAANSYVSLAEADAYFATRLNADAWAQAGQASPPRQEAALITATQRLDQEPFRGRRTYRDQALSWPRAGVRGADGLPMPPDEIPGDIKRAQMELALAMLTEDLLADTGLEGFERLRIGPIEIETRERKAGALPANVTRFVRQYREGSALQFQILRG